MGDVDVNTYRCDVNSNKMKTFRAVANDEITACYLG